MSSNEVGPEHVDERARELKHGGEGHDPLEGEPKSADRAAKAILEDSEARTLDEAARDPEEDTVIRRDSEEAAATGEPGA